MIQLLNVQLTDNAKGCMLDQDLNNARTEDGPEPIRAQHAFYEWLKLQEQV